MHTFMYMYNKLVAELVMGRICMGRVGYGPSLSWAEFVMGRDVQLPNYSPRAVTGLTRDANLDTQSISSFKMALFYSGLPLSNL